MEYLVTSIITTHHREARIVERALKSVLQQTYKQIEVIIINDAPTFSGNEQIESMLKQYESYNIKYVINDKKSGACASRNIGIKLANGEFIALLDDDDEWASTKIEDMLSVITDDVGLIYSNYDNIKNGKVFSKSRANVYEGHVYEKLLYENFIGGCSIPLFRKNVICEAGYFDEDMPSAQDIDMWLRISRLCKIKYINKILVHYYISDIAITSNVDKRIRGWKLLIDKYTFDLMKHMDAFCIWYYNIIETEIAFGRFKSALNNYKNIQKHISYKKKCKLFIYGLIKYLLVLTGLRKR